jgi:hypothetical protein
MMEQTAMLHHDIQVKPCSHKTAQGHKHQISCLSSMSSSVPATEPTVETYGEDMVGCRGASNRYGACKDSKQRLHPALHHDTFAAVFQSHVRDSCCLVPQSENRAQQGTICSGSTY